MDNITWKQCPLCGSSDFRQILSCRDHSASGETFPVCRCSHCGFTFTQSIPDETEIGHYYDFPEYVSHSDTSEGLMFKLYHAARSVMLRRKCRLVTETSAMKSGHLLDYGAGTGYFANAMQQEGWMVTAIEKSDSARHFGKERFHIEMQEEQQFYRIEKESFDVITLWHVMEHVQQLDRLWAQLSEVLKNDGTLIVAVPNCVSADARHYREWWAAYDVPRHLWHFSPETLAAWGEKYGFRLKAIRKMPLDAFYISMLSEQHKGSSKSFLKGMWRGVLCWFRSLFHTSDSSSLIYILKKMNAA